MKKIGLIIKDASEHRIKKTFEGSSAFFVVKYSGLSSPEMTALRKSLKAAKANLFVAKNSVARKAFKSLGLDPVVGSIEGPCGLVFVNEEPVDASKALYAFAKEHEALKLESGCLAQRILNRQDIESLAKLPSKDVLRAMVVMTMNAPVAGIVRTLNGVLSKFVRCLDQIKQKKGA